MDSSGDWLFVTNSNADLRYNDGTLIALSLERAADDRAKSWGPCDRVSHPNPRTDELPFCCWDTLDRSALNCDERAYIGPDDDIGNGAGNIRIGSFAAAMVLQKPECPTACAEPCPDSPGDNRLLIGVRGDTSLTFVDVGAGTPDMPPALTCSSGGEDFATCDEAYRVNKAGSALAAPSPEAMAPEVALPDEPYALALDDTNGLLYIGHLTGNTSRPFTGGFSLFDVAFGEGPLNTPRLISPFPSPFTPSSLGSVGVSALKSYKTGRPGTNIYASSRFVPQVAPLGVTAVCPQTDSSIREIAAFPNGDFYTSPLTGTETRGIEFVGERAFVLQRSPPALISFLNPYTPSEVLETCSSPTFLDQYENEVGIRLFVTCFADGEIYVFDPAVPQLVRTFIVGRGPAGLVFDKQRQVAYSVNFGDNDIAVIDLKPGSPTEYHVIQRIGFPRTAPR